MHSKYVFGCIRFVRLANPVRGIVYGQGTEDDNHRSSSKAKLIRYVHFFLAFLFGRDRVRQLFRRLN